MSIPLILLAALSAQAGDAPRQTFASYRAALLADDGNAAAGLVSDETLAYFGEMTQLAVCGSPGDVAVRSPVDRMQVAILRHRVPTAELVTMSGRDTFIYAVERGWVGKGGLTSAELGEITIDGDAASATLVVNGQPAPGGTFDFKRENGSWKLDVVAALTAGNAVLEQLALQQGVEEDALILGLVARVSGTPPPENIWDPVAPGNERCSAGR